MMGLEIVSDCGCLLHCEEGGVATAVMVKPAEYGLES